MTIPPPPLTPRERRQRLLLWAISVCAMVLLLIVIGLFMKQPTPSLAEYHAPEPLTPEEEARREIFNPYDQLVEKMAEDQAAHEKSVKAAKYNILRPYIVARLKRAMAGHDGDVERMIALCDAAHLGKPGAPDLKTLIGLPPSVASVITGQEDAAAESDARKAGP